MKRFLLFVVAGMMSVLAAQAQLPGGIGGMGGAAKSTIVGKVSGTIIDSLTKKPVDYASVALIKADQNNKPIGGSLTDDKGAFKIPNITPGKYILTVAFIGYSTKRIVNVQTSPEKPDLNLGRILLAPSQQSLKEVQVVGQAALVENKIDKLVYNAEQDVTSAGGNAGDVLRKVPMLSVDLDGNVSLRGSSAVKILINGKPSGTMANNVADALKMIPAGEIKNVEVITSPSAKYDAEGTGGIINIITKKKSAEGVSGSVNIAAGTRINNANANLTVKSGRLSVNGNLGGNYFKAPNTGVTIINDFFANNTKIEQNGFTTSKRYGYTGGAGFDYDINSYNNISSSIKFNSFTFGTDGTMNGITTSPLGVINSTRMTDNNAGSRGFDWSSDYRKTFKKQGEEFSVSGQVSMGRNPSKFTSDIEIAGQPQPPIIGDNTGKNNEYTLQTDYTYPINSKITLETGLKGIMRDITSQYLNSMQNFKYNQDVGAAYGVMSFQLGKYGIKAGTRLEYTNIKWSSPQAGDFPKDYLNLFPSLTISKSLKNYSTMKVSYSRRIQRPSLFYLNPFRDTSDPQNMRQGNPNLAPEISDQVEFGYSTFIKGSMLNISVFYKNTSNFIESRYLPDQKLTTYLNVGHSPSYGVNLFGSYNPMPKWTIMSNVNLNTYQTSNAADGTTAGPYLNYGIMLRTSYGFNGGWFAEAFSLLNSPRRTAQGKLPGFNLLVFGAKKELMKKKASIGLSVANPFAKNKDFITQLQTADFLQYSRAEVPFRSFGVSFTYSFGKMSFGQQPKKKKGVNNDDQKQGEEGGQMGGGGGGGGGR